MKILFLDIDGVVNCETTSQRHRGFIGIDPYMAFLVGRIVQQTDAKVVLSSSWRNFEDGVEEVERQVVPIMEVTPNGKSRGEEIQAWLDNQAIKSNFVVEKYAILDDDRNMLESQLPNFFNTSWLTGLTEEIADKVIAHLNGA